MIVIVDDRDKYFKKLENENLTLKDNNNIKSTKIHENINESKPKTRRRIVIQINSSKNKKSHISGTISFLPSRSRTEARTLKRSTENKFKSSNSLDSDASSESSLNSCKISRSKSINEKFKRNCSKRYRRAHSLNGFPSSSFDQSKYPLMIKCCNSTDIANNIKSSQPARRISSITKGSPSLVKKVNQLVELGGSFHLVAKTIIEALPNSQQGIYFTIHMFI